MSQTSKYIIIEVYAVMNVTSLYGDNLVKLLEQIPQEVKDEFKKKYSDINLKELTVRKFE